MSRIRINWVRRGRDLLEVAGVMACALSIGFAFAVAAGAFEGIFWCECVVGAGVAFAALWGVWKWLTQDDFGGDL